MMFGIETTWPIRVLMVQPSHRVVLKAVRQGFDIWAVVDPRRYEAAQLRQLGSDAKRVLVVDTDDQAALDALVAKTVRRNRIEHVLCRCGRSHGLRRESMVMPGPHNAVQLLSPAGGTSAPSGWAESLAEIHEVLSDFGYSAASRGPGAAPWPGRTEDVEDRRRDGLGPLERALDEPAFVVTTLTFEGMHQVLGVTAKSSEFLLHPAQLPERHEAAIRAAATSLLDLAGYERGPAHTTVVLTERGLRLDTVKTWFEQEEFLSLLQFCTGLDLEAELVRLFTDGLVLKPLVDRCATVQFLRPGAGRVVSVAGLAETGALPGVLEVRFPYRAGDLLTPADAGFLFVEGDSAAAARSRALTARAGVRVVVEEA